MIGVSAIRFFPLVPAKAGTQGQVALDSRLRGNERLMGVALLLLFCVFAALPAQARELRVPQDGKPALVLDLPRGWQTKPDKVGGMLLIPPAQSQHALLYLGILHDPELDGAMDVAVAAKVGRKVGVTGFDKQEAARLTDDKGAVHRGTSFYAKVPEKHGLWRRARIVIVPLGRTTWAQAWVVTQPGMNYVESAKLDKVLESITLANP